MQATERTPCLSQLHSRRIIDKITSDTDKSMLLSVDEFPRILDCHNNLIIFAKIIFAKITLLHIATLSITPVSQPDS